MRRWSDLPGFALALTAILALMCKPLLAYQVDSRGIVILEGFVNTDEQAIVIDGRLDFEIDAGPLTLGGAYRTYDFGNGRYNPAGIQPFSGLKHRYIELSKSDLTLRAGHFFATFGKGLSLRSFEDIELEHDTWLDGILASYESNTLAISILGGKEVEEVSRFQHIEHKVRSGWLEGHLGEMVRLAASALERTSRKYDDRQALPESLSTFQDRIYGFEASLKVGWLGLLGDYARRFGDLYATGARDAQGYGAYASATIETDAISLLCEYKNYKAFSHDLSSPPICVKEHLWTLMNRVTHEVNYNDERGFLAEGMIPLGNWFISGGASEARSHEGGLRHWEMFAHIENSETFLGFRSLAGSWSREYFAGRFSEYQNGAVEFKASPLERTTEIDIEAQRVEEPDGHSFFNYLLGITCYLDPNFTVSWVSERTTDHSEGRNVWMMGSVRITLPQDLEVSLAGGTERGGKKCSGGICYNEPEFAGFRIKVAKFF